mgnify:CR=1 FL=1
MWADAWCAVATAGFAFSRIRAMDTAEIYSVRSAAAKSIDGKPGIDVVQSTIKPSRETRIRKLATANAVVVSRPPLTLVSLSILPHRMIPQHPIPAPVNLLSRSASGLPMVGRRPILRLIPKPQTPAAVNLLS